MHDMMSIYKILSCFPRNMTKINPLTRYSSIQDWSLEFHRVLTSSECFKSGSELIQEYEKHENRNLYGIGLRRRIQPDYLINCNDHLTQEVKREASISRLSVFKNCGVVNPRTSSRKCFRNRPNLSNLRFQDCEPCYFTKVWIG